MYMYMCSCSMLPSVPVAMLWVVHYESVYSFCIQLLCVAFVRTIPYQPLTVLVLPDQGHNSSLNNIVSSEPEKQGHKWLENF